MNNYTTYVIISSSIFPFEQIMSNGEATVEAGLAASLRLTAFVDIEKSFWGTLKEAAIGLKLEGSLDSNLEIKINGKLRFDDCAFFWRSSHLEECAPKNVLSKTSKCKGGRKRLSTRKHNAKIHDCFSN